MAAAPPQSRLLAAVADNTATAAALPSIVQGKQFLGKRLRNGRQEASSIGPEVASLKKVKTQRHVEAVAVADDSGEVSYDLVADGDDDWLPQDGRAQGDSQKQRNNVAEADRRKGTVDMLSVSSGSSSSEGGSSSSFEVTKRKLKGRRTSAAAGDDSCAGGYSGGGTGRTHQFMARTQQQQQANHRHLQRQQQLAGEPGEQDDDCFIVEEPRGARVRGTAGNGECESVNS
jgi:hypothetical protein